MTFTQMRLSLQLMVEERIGAPRSLAARLARAEEDAAFAAMKGGTP